MLRLLHPRLLPLAAAAVVVAAGAFHTLRRPSPPPPHGVQFLGPGNYDDRRIAAKERIAEAAAAGRLTLLEAAAAFRDMDSKGAPYAVEAVTRFDPDMSVDEGYCRMVVTWVGWRDSDQAKKSARLLRAELNARRKDGTLRLPEAPADTPERPLTPVE